MDRVRDLVAAGDVSVVLAQDRDRFAREPAYHYLLRREFEERSCKIKALNDRGDESPEGELTDGILDQLAKFERAKLTERTRRGKLRKAREGKIIASGYASIGFAYDADRIGYVVDELEMPVAHRIFRMIGVEGKTLSAVKTTLDHERVPTPGGARFWSRPTLRALILDDVYKPHTFEEIKELISPDVASRLDRTRCYGMWWYNRRHIVEKRVSEPGENGRIYRRRRKVTEKPREEWIGVTVPDAGLEREVVEAAREAIRNNRKTSNVGHRFWELSGGVSQCAECGRSLVTSVSYGRNNKPYFYYVCPRNYEHHWGACPSTKCHRAKELEERVWSLVSGLLKDPERLRAGLERTIEEELRRADESLARQDHRG